MDCWEDGEIGGPYAHLVPQIQLGNIHVSENTREKPKIGRTNPTTKLWRHIVERRKDRDTVGSKRGLGTVHEGKGQVGMKREEINYHTGESLFGFES